MDNSRKDNAFSLIELMIGVAIIATLIATATPIYRQILNRARAAEASSNLNTIRSLEVTYKAVHDEYLVLPAHPAEVPSDYELWGDPGGNWDKIGFGAGVAESRVRYQYKVVGIPLITTSFLITAQSDFDGQGAPYDTWSLNNSGTFTHTDKYK